MHTCEHMLSRIQLRQSKTGVFRVIESVACQLRHACTCTHTYIPFMHTHTHSFRQSNMGIFRLFDVNLLNMVCVCVCVRARMHVHTQLQQSNMVSSNFGSLSNMCGFRFVGSVILLIGMFNDWASMLLEAKNKNVFKTGRIESYHGTCTILCLNTVDLYKNLLNVACCCAIACYHR